MYAIVETGGKQYRVEKGTSLLVDRLSAKEGDKVALRAVMFRDDDVVTAPGELEKVKVEATVAEHLRGPKIKVFKYKPKKGYRRRAGHRSELTKLTTTRTVLAVDLALIVLVAAAVALHAVALPVDRLDSGPLQRGVLTDVGVNLGGLFAALLGALIFTIEVRTGTIRPTLLVVPVRWRVMAAKALAAALAGALTAAIATVTAVGVGALAFTARDGLSFSVGGPDVLRLVLGSLGVGVLLSLLGLAVGALVRSQVPTVVGIFAWLLFVENLMIDLPSVHRFVPGALAQAMAGQVRDGVLSSSWAATATLAAYATAAVTLGIAVTSRRDFA